MFKFLKEKLKSWISKSKEDLEESPVEEKEVEKPKITKKETRLKKEKQKPKKQEKAETPKEPEKKPVSKQEPREKEPEKIIEEIKQEVEEKKGFFGIFKRKKQEPEKIIEEIKQEVEEKPKAKEKEESKKEPKQVIEEQKPKIEEVEEKRGFFDRFKKKLDNEKFEEMFSELELILLQNNVANVAVHSIKLSLQEQLIGKNLSDIDLGSALKVAIENILINPPEFIKEIKKTLEVKKPYVIAFVGINGSGKTTTIAKTAHMLKKHGFTVCLAAADTFRAAAIQQLEEHAKRLNVPIIKKDYGSDPASVGFDAISYAKKHHIDIVLIDTAGRMNTKDSLMIEMEKVIRVNKPDMRIFVGESITGNDATEQAKAFNDAIDLTGIILSKADVDEKGGTAISVSHVTKKPVLFLGMGQTYDDLEVFDKSNLIEKLGL